MRLTQIIEALLFASDSPLSAADLSRVDERLDEDTVEAVIQELRAEYELSERSFQIYEVGGGYQLLTRPEFVTILERYETVPQSSRLSAPALEVLAIIAYRQPLGRAEIEDIRGVGSSGVLRTLQERSLIEPVARGEGLGRPLLYGTTRKFLEHFGFRSLEDLPRPDELPVVLRERPAVSTIPLDADEAPQPADATGEAPQPPAAVEEAPVSAEPGPEAPSDMAEDTAADQADAAGEAADSEPVAANAPEAGGAADERSDDEAADAGSTEPSDRELDEVPHRG
ncbi:MAG TPA: SMC-Scp complex subunit ScpB [Longimicrobiales bacterium]